METPIQLKLIGIENGMYKLKYPNLKIPIEVNKELYERFCQSREYRITDLRKTGTKHRVNSNDVIHRWL